MRAKNSNLVPIAFWIGFLGLGLAVSMGGHDRAAAHKPRAGHAAKMESLKEASTAKDSETQREAAVD